MRLQMLFEVLFHSKSFITFIASVWAIISVYSLMFVQVPFVHECFITKRANKLSDTAMYIFVLFEMILSSKASPTFIAFKWFFVRMSLHMILQCRLHAKRFFANITNDALCFIVSSFHMVSEM